MRLLALVACGGDYEGPWLIARGSETGAYVTGQEEDGEEVGLEVELKGEDIHHRFGLRPGLNILHDTNKWSRYKTWKRGTSKSVTVEVYLDRKEEI